MGIKERRQRQFQERESRFLQAARELVAENGLLNLQMSRIAEKCEYAVGTLYQHFDSKEDLVLALAAEGARHHVELFRRVERWSAPARDRLLAIGVADMLFVQHNPELFRVGQYAFTEVVWGAASAERRQELLAVNAPVSEIVIGIIESAVRAGELSPGRISAQRMAVGFWSLIIGTHSLVHAEGVLEDFEVREPYRLMGKHLQALFNGHGWLPLADVQDDAALAALMERIRQELFADLVERSAR